MYVILHISYNYISLLSMPIYKDKKRNTYYFRTYITNNKGIRKQYERSGFKTKSDAINKERELINSFDLGNKKDMTFNELYNIFIKDKSQKLKYQSLRSTKSKFSNHILPFYNDYLISKIDNKVYLDWKDYILSKNFSYKYNSSLHVCMVSIFNYAIDFDYLEKNIASKVGNFSKKNYSSKINYWNFEEFNQFINVVDNNLLKCLFNLLYYTGIRLGECLALNWNDIKENYIDINKTISKGKLNNDYIITNPKTQKSIRKVYLDNKTIEMLRDLKDYYSGFCNFNNNWYVFGGIKPLSQTTITRKKNNYCKIANVKQIKIHDFRHSHASLLISNGTPITVVSERLGHADKSTTLNVYSHMFQSDNDKAINLINDLRK